MIDKLDLIEKNTSIEEGNNLIKSFSFENDNIHLKKYLDMRLEKHLFSSINNDQNWLRKLPCTSAQVERSFSQLKKML